MNVFTIEAKQALRMRRFLMSVAMYVVCGALAQFGATLGYLPANLPMWWMLGAAMVNLVFFYLIRSGNNLRLRDPSMTELQLVFSMIAAMALISQADQARGAMLMFVPIPLLFGILYLNLRQIARVSIVGFLSYLLVIAFIFVTQPQRLIPTLEAFHLLILATAMIFVGLMCGYISKVRADLAEANREIEELANRDPLTGLFNRRRLMERLESDILRCNRLRTRGIILCMVDLDHFKQVNDTFGHPVGDEVLVMLGNSLLNSVRDIDCVARYGGEEFIVLLDADSDSDSDDLALVMSERIRAKVQELRVPSRPELLISVSIGVASLKNRESALDLITRADKALYLAKAAGRNRVHLATCANEDADVQPQGLTLVTG
ncbi:GGDEF domain-containing protein [Rhodoferax sp. PAMC 29310]|uniref:GGDEF domain-containing protein n=1 Tax=Rhodoferax sp. PAMC 29310 TaxID=2822760 RepID=UPI001B32B696|nr:GGDEF domain-containing protein [Rhodoferax sp. PAMC 29310]